MDNQLYISSDDLDLARVHNLRNPREIDTTLPSTSRQNEIYMMQFRNEGGGKVYLYKMVLYKKKYSYMSIYEHRIFERHEMMLSITYRLIVIYIICCILVLFVDN